MTKDQLRELVDGLTDDDLREIARWMEKRQHTENAGLLRKAAGQLEVLAGAYATASRVKIGS